MQTPPLHTGTHSKTVGGRQARFGQKAAKNSKHTGEGGPAGSRLAPSHTRLSTCASGLAPKASEMLGLNTQGFMALYKNITSPQAPQLQKYDPLKGLNEEKAGDSVKNKWRRRGEGLPSLPCTWVFLSLNWAGETA